MTPAFGAGDRVVVAERDVTGHTRTPRYVKGKIGIVERYCGLFGNPEQLAYGRRDGPAIPLYRVRFIVRDVFGSAEDDADTLDVELYEHWLERDGSG